MSTQSRDRALVVGASVAGLRCAQALRAGGHDGEIIVVGAETQFPYDRPPLSKQLLTGTWSQEEIRLAEPDELDSAAIELRLGTAASRLHVADRRIDLADGSGLEYDHLVVATGVRPRPLPWRTGTGVVRTVRSLDDALGLREQLLTSDGPLVVVGGGFVGAEVAASAAALGVPCTIVEALPTPFSRALGPTVGSLVARLHTDNGVRVVAGTGVVGIEQDGAVALVRLADGRTLPASTVVAGIGCVPNTEWLESSGLLLDDGVVTDEFCRATGAEDVYAVGDVARWWDVRAGTWRRTEHWTHATQQAHVAAHNILHPDDLRPHTKAPYFWSDQHGVKIQMVGLCSPDDDVEVLRRQTSGGDRDVALYSRAGRLTACTVFGWPKLTQAVRRVWESEPSTQAVVDLIDSLTLA